MIHYDTILVGTEFSPMCEVAFRATAAIAAMTKAKRVVLEHVLVEGPAYMPMLPAEVADAVESGATEAAERKLASLTIELPGVTVLRDVRRGLPARELVQAARDHNADLVVVASHGRSGLGRFFYGSVAMSLLRAVHCPVLVVREGAPIPPRFETILASVDLSPAAPKVLAHAAGMAAASGAALHVLSSFESPVVSADPGDFLPRYLSAGELARLEDDYRRRLEELVRGVVPTGEVRIDVVRKVPPSAVILDTVAMVRPSLVVLGTSGRNAWNRMLLGSTANRVLAEVALPVLVVPHDAPEPKKPA